MAAFLHIFLILSVSTLCIASRNEEEDSNKTQADASPHLLSVTHTGHVVRQRASNHHAFTLSSSESGNNGEAGHAEAKAVVQKGRKVTKKARKRRDKRAKRAKHLSTSFGQFEDDEQFRSKSLQVGRGTGREAAKRKNPKNKQNEETQDADEAPEKKTNEVAVEAPKKTDEDAEAPKTDNEAEDEDKCTKLEGDDKEECEHKEKLAGAHELTKHNFFMLDVGWAVECMVIIGSLCFLMVYWPYQYVGNKDISVFFEPVGDEATSEKNTLSVWCYESLWGRNDFSYFFNAVSITLAIANFVMFALQTEVAYVTTLEKEDGYEAMTYFGVKLSSWVPDTNYYLQIVSIFIFGTFIIMRVIGSMAHPFWDNYGGMAPIAFLFGDFYIHMEILALVPSIIDLVTGVEWYQNFIYLSLIRTVEIMMRQGQLGSALRQFESLVDDVPILRMIFGYTLVLWVCLSGLYYVANHDNEAAVWEAVKYEEHLWQRFSSIPSSMFFVLINLSCEYPLADVHETWLSRLMVLIACGVGVPLFAIPTGIVGSALQDKTVGEIDDRRQNGTGDGQAPAAVDDIEDIAENLRDYAGWSPWDWTWSTIMFCLSFGSVFLYFFWTATIAAAAIADPHARDKYNKYLGVNIHISENMLALVDGGVGVIFLIDFGAALKERFSGGEADAASNRYFFTLKFLVDFFSSIPGIVHCALFLSGTTSGGFIDFMRAACVLRVLKPDRYIGAFKVLMEIMKEHAAILQATFFVSGLLVIICSTLLYYTERDSPDEEMRDYYGSAARSIWAELINLHGEWVWCDYSAHGKAICVIIDFIAIGICMVPIAVFSEGYSDRLSTSSEESSLAMKPWQQSLRPEEEGKKRGIYDLFYSHLHMIKQKRSFAYYSMFLASLFTTAMSVGVTVAVTLERFDGKGKDEDVWLGVFYGMDVYCAVFFVVELLLRCSATNGKHIISITGICDILSLVAIIGTLGKHRKDYLHPNYHDDNFIYDIVIPVRLLRIFCVESYSHAIDTIGKVSYINRKALMRSFYFLVCIWYIFGTCLYLCEREWPGNEKKALEVENVGKHSMEKEDEEDEITMKNRYADILTGLQYALVHITGDYPIADYQFQSMPFHFFFCTAGMICISAFTGIFTAGIHNFLKDEHALGRRSKATKRLSTMINSIIFLQYKFRSRRRRRGRVENWEDAGARHPFGFIRELVNGTTYSGQVFQVLCSSALIVNIFNTMASTVQDIEDRYPSVLESVELMTAIIFAIEYLCKLLTGSPPFSNFFNPMRLIDLFCLTPSIFYAINGGEGAKKPQRAMKWSNEDDMERIIECAMIFRCVRIFDIPFIRKEMKRTYKELSAAAASLFMPFSLGIAVWVFTSSLFHWVEQTYENAPEKENMTSIPATMYWTIIFIIGEWANVDFSAGAGSRICIFYCLVGVAVCAIPIGIIADSIADSIKTICEERRELDHLYRLGSGFDPANQSAKQASFQYGNQMPEMAPPPQNGNMGGPMGPGYGAPMAATQPLAEYSGGPLAEPMYMPRHPHQENAMFVPRPPGVLAQPPPGYGGPQSFKGGPQSFKGGPQNYGSPQSFKGAPESFKGGGPESFKGGPESSKGGPESFKGGAQSFQGGKPGMYDHLNQSFTISPGQPGMPPSSGPGLMPGSGMIPPGSGGMMSPGPPGMPPQMMSPGRPTMPPGSYGQTPPGSGPAMPQSQPGMMPPGKGNMLSIPGKGNVPPSGQNFPQSFQGKGPYQPQALQGKR